MPRLFRLDMIHRVLLLLFACVTVCQARLGQTYEQVEAEYGAPKNQIPAGLQTPLLDGAREYTFEHKGWRIRCALLLAKDGKYYVVRKHYVKVTNPSLLKSGVLQTITDQEMKALLSVEYGQTSWQLKSLNELGPDMTGRLGVQMEQIARSTNNVWVRGDGALANLSVEKTTLLLELPHAAKFEAEMLARRKK